MKSSFCFSSESVGEGHPDKVADSISDSILDACLEQDPASRVACETMVKSNLVFLAGEITTSAKLNYNDIVRDAIREIGYTNDDDVFHADQVFINNAITRQSPDIQQGVDAAAAAGKATSEQGAGDQGIMFGYATTATEELMPAPVMFAHRLLRELADIRKNSNRAPWLRPDCKSQVAVDFEDGNVVGIRNVVISTQHAASVERKTLESFLIEEVIRKTLPADLIKNAEFLINPTGTFVIGGPQGDAGLTGRKIIVDTYGGWSRHGGGAFSGKDATKVDRSAAYMARWVAKHVVGAGLASRCEVQLAYAIGYPHPTSVFVDTFGSGELPDSKIAEALQKVFSFKPADIVTQLGLRSAIFRSTTHYGHFGKSGLPWEELTKLEELKAAL